VLRRSDKNIHDPNLRTFKKTGLAWVLATMLHFGLNTDLVLGWSISSGISSFAQLKRLFTKCTLIDGFAHKVPLSLFETGTFRREIIFEAMLEIRFCQFV
jgi:hypothetical protein